MQWGHVRGCCQAPPYPWNCFSPALSAASTCRTGSSVKCCHVLIWKCSLISSADVESLEKRFRELQKLRRTHSGSWMVWFTWSVFGFGDCLLNFWVSKHDFLEFIFADAFPFTFQQRFLRSFPTPLPISQAKSEQAALCPYIYLGQINSRALILGCFLPPVLKTPTKLKPLLSHRKVPNHTMHPQGEGNYLSCLYNNQVSAQE